MTWARRSGTAAKYRTATHRRERAARMAEYERIGYVTCAQDVCVMATRTMAWPEPAHLGHDETGQHFIGLVHPLCNVKDAARRASRRSHGLASTTRWDL